MPIVAYRAYLDTTSNVSTRSRYTVEVVLCLLAGAFFSAVMMS